MFRRMKRLLRLRNKSGFTLVEVIIACALLGILVIGIMGFATPILNSVREKEQNARATLLSEAIDVYIANSIQYAFYVVAVDYAASTDTVSVGGAAPIVSTVKYNDSYFGSNEQGKGLNNLLDRFSSLNPADYEIRCIGIRWMDIPGTSTKKLMLTNEKVNPANGALDASATVPVFDPVFYEGMYPIIKLENYSKEENPYYDESKPIDPVSNPKYLNDADGSELHIAPAIRVVSDIYLTPDCYNIQADVRKNAIQTFTGFTYADLTNIRSSAVNRTGTYKLHPTVSLHTTTEGGVISPSYDGAREADAGAQYVENGETYYYPNSFIYYIVRKIKSVD